MMKTFNLTHTDLNVSEIALGCMRISSLSEDRLEELIRCALDLGINFFDHADIYGTEPAFGQVLAKHPELRKQMIIQSKCDIVKQVNGGPRYDTTKDYIIGQAEQSIANLHCDYLDILLLHRPDPLMDPQEVAQAFQELHDRKLVRYFGVSNFPASKMRMLQKFIDQDLIVNQIQLSAVHALAIDESVFFNMTDDHAISRTDQILDYALENDLALQAWCPFQASWQDGTYLDNPKYPKLNAVLETLATKYQVTKSAIGAAWILRLPVKIQVIAGTTNPTHLKEIVDATKIELTCQEWYDIYTAQHHPLP